MKSDSLLECLVEGDRGGDMRVFELIEYVGCWHFSDMADLADDVRSLGQSRLTADIAETTRLMQGGHCNSASFLN